MIYFPYSCEKTLMLLGYLNRVKKNESRIYYVGTAHVILFIIFLILIQFDSRQVLGINTWIKPAKFAIANAIFLWTIGGYLMVTASGKFRNVLSWGFVICITIEMLLIGFQGCRANTSHFNFSSIFDGALYGVMGIAIYFNTLFVLLLFGQFLFQKSKIQISINLWVAMVSGLLLCLFGGYFGQALVDNHAHTVGSNDGSPGIFFFNWSTTNGDLRVAHFSALHGLQIIPLTALVIGRLFKDKVSSMLTILVALVYLAIVIFIWLQARSGEPFISF